MLKRKIPSAGTPVQLSDLIIAIKGAFGKEAPLLERIIEKLLNIKHCLLVNSGTTAFYVILKAIKKFSDKNEVILPAYTAPSLILSIKKAGLKYRLVDISLKTFNMDAEKVMSAIGSETMAVMPVHMFGLPFAIDKFIDEIKGLQNEEGFYIIEDAASSFGTMRKNGKYTGTFGDIGFFSFNRGKNLSITTGGAIVTDDDRLSAIISEEIRNLPRLDTNGRLILFLKTVGLSLAVRPWFYTLFQPFISKFKYMTLHQDFDSFQYTDFQRALGISLFRKANNIFHRRMENGLYLVKALKDMMGIRLPVLSDNWQIVFNQFPILVEDEWKREKALHEIYKTGVEATTLYDKPIHLIYEGNNFDVDPFPNATYLSRRLILIPTHPLIGIKNLKKVVDAINRGLR